MSAPRMTDEEFNAPGWWSDDYTTALWDEAVRARTQEAKLEAIVEVSRAEMGKLVAEVERLRSELADARRVWKEATVTPSGAARVAGLAALRDEVSACRADNLRLVAENARLKEARRGK